MRPFPRSRHYLALLIFAGVSIASGYFAMVSARPGARQVQIATAAAKRHHPDLYAADAIYGTHLWRFHSPTFQGAMDMVLVPTGYEDLTLPFRLTAGVAVMVYLCGMYALLFRQCRSWSVAAFVAVLSTAVVYALNGTFWGIGSLESITPGSLVLAIVPLILMAYLRYGRQWRVLLVFGFVGLCGNLSLLTAMNVALVLAIVHLGRRGFRPAAWGTVAAGLGAAMLTASPYLTYYLTLRRSLPTGDRRLSMSAAVEALRIGGLDVLYPEMLASMLNWLLMAGVLVIPAAVVLSRVERFRLRNLRLWVWLGVGGLAVSLGFQGLSQLVGSLTGGPPAVIDFVTSSSLVMLSLYVLFAQSLTNLFRLIIKQRVWIRWACAALAAVWIIPSDNFRVPRHALYEAATMFMAEEDKPPRVQQLHERDEQAAELRRITQWAADPANTSIDAIFITDDPEFRMRSRRSVVACHEDVRVLYYMSPGRLERWSKIVRRQERLLHPKAGARADPYTIRNFAHELARGAPYDQADEWYVILASSAAPKRPGGLTELRSPGWGKWYHLYRVH